MTKHNRDAIRGQAGYTKGALAAYDFLVLGVSNRLIWRCPTRHLLALYDAHVSANHLDVGVGTGYFLDRCAFPTPKPRLVLLDLNPNCLEFTASRIERYAPKSYRRNVLEPLDIDEKAFDSIAVNYLLHCLPGAIHTKTAVFRNVNAFLKPGGIVFGATLLQGGVQRSFLAKRLMDFYNAKRVFTNVADDLVGLKRILADHYSECATDVRGCAALFWARK
ncbi:MAG: class I SAM-dependent methyltransferase [Acidiferrobacterales bacterium]